MIWIQNYPVFVEIKSHHYGFKTARSTNNYHNNLGEFNSSNAKLGFCIRRAAWRAFLLMLMHLLPSRLYRQSLYNNTKMLVALWPQDSEEAGYCLENLSELSCMPMKTWLNKHHKRAKENYSLRSIHSYSRHVKTVFLFDDAFQLVW